MPRRGDPERLGRPLEEHIYASPVQDLALELAADPRSAKSAYLADEVLSTSRRPGAEDFLGDGRSSVAVDHAVCLCHALSCLAARDRRLHRPDDARAEPREAGLGRRAIALRSASDYWFATFSIAWSNSTPRFHSPMGTRGPD